MKRARVQISFDEGSSLTKQSFREECDVNTVVARFVRTGVLAPGSLNPKSPLFGDVSGVGGFREALEMVREAEEAFASLPSAVRDRFANDPGNLVEFLQTPGNLPEARELGLVPKLPSEPVVAPTEAPPVKEVKS